MGKGKPDKNRVFTVNLKHDGLFTIKPFAYMNFDKKKITDLNFEGMSCVELFDVVRHLVHNPLRRLYYCKVGTPLRLDIKEIKNDVDVHSFLTCGFESK